MSGHLVQKGLHKHVLRAAIQGAISGDSSASTSGGSAESGDLSVAAAGSDSKKAAVGSGVAVGSAELRTSLKWLEDDLSAKSIIEMTLADEHLALFDCTTALELVEAIEARWQPKGRAQRFELRRKFAQLKMGKESTLSYVGRGKALSIEMANAKIVVDEEQLAMQLLVGLDDKYAAMVSTFGMMTVGEFGVDTILPQMQLREQEIARENGGGASSMALFSGVKGGGSGGSPSSQVPQGSCFYCQASGHMKSGCPRFLAEDPSGFWEYQKQRRDKQQQQERQQGAGGKKILNM